MPLLTDLLILGGIGTVGYVYRDEITQFLKDNNLWPFPDGQQPCPSGTVLTTAGCKPPPGGCTKVCTPPQVLNASCTCVDPVQPPPTGGNIAFCAAGDWGSGKNSNWQKTVATMKTLHPNVVLVPGDTAYSGGSAKFKPVTDAIKAFPEHPKVLGARGNHDSGDESLFNAYSNSVTTIGNTSFMALDANSTSSAISYARANFSKMTGKWKVVFFHQPAVSPSSSHGTGGMSALKPDFDKAKIHLVIQAHNHIYARYAKTAGGVTYVMSGLGGEGPYPIGSNCSGCPQMVKSYNKGFGTFFAQTSTSSVACKFVINGGSVFDSFTI